MLGNTPRISPEIFMRPKVLKNPGDQRAKPAARCWLDDGGATVVDDLQSIPLSLVHRKTIHDRLFSCHD